MPDSPRSQTFFERPILNSPYAYPGRHWQLEGGRPTDRIVERRRDAAFLTAVAQSKRGGGPGDQGRLDLAERTEDGREYAYAVINAVREKVDAWRRIADPNAWRVTPTTRRLLNHWRTHPFAGIRPFFCQIEAAETAIWLAEVAPRSKANAAVLEDLERVNAEANPGLSRVALKLATGAGKTTVMAMLIAWQTLNKVARPGSTRFTDAFLVVAPGITIKDRLRVLRPNDPGEYYKSRELVPRDLLPGMKRARIVVTNYHAFGLRERFDAAAGARRALEGRGGPLDTKESPGQMLRRVMPELMNAGRVCVINDEAHHCYREKPGRDEPGGDEEGRLSGDDLQEANRNEQAARQWIGGLEAVAERLGGKGGGVGTVYDLSATPFFLQGSGYAEGTLFPWTVSDFSLMDAVESGIVKLPRVPVADNLPAGRKPLYRDLWPAIRKAMPKGRSKARGMAPGDLPTELKTALDALYGHYVKVDAAWRRAGIAAPPCFIVVCNNTTSSKLVYDYIAGHETEPAEEGGAPGFVEGALELFRNHDDYHQPLARPNTLLIDSAQLESGDALDKTFRDDAAAEIDQFRREMRERGDGAAAETVSEQDLLREVMNTVGKEGKLGGRVRCVVSVAMLTEGWDANNVTHVLGLRAFGTQLLCEQVIGRALRRMSYDTVPDPVDPARNPDGVFEAEYADILGIDFDFTAEPVVAEPKPPAKTTRVEAVRPARDHLEIVFPRVRGYRVELPQTTVDYRFGEDSTLVLTPEMTGATHTLMEGIVGEGADLTLEHLKEKRPSAVVFHLTNRLLATIYRRGDGSWNPALFGRLKPVVRTWLENHLVCKGDTFPGQLLYQELADEACGRINHAITLGNAGARPVRALPDPANPVGSTHEVGFSTRSADLWRTDPRRCPVDWVVLDSGWEAEFCRVLESHDKVLRYVKNHGLGLEIPYAFGGAARTYRPDFIVVADDGRGPADPLSLVIEIKGRRREDAKAKAEAAAKRWVPGVNNLGEYGRWAFAEFTDPFELRGDLDGRIRQQVDAWTGGPNDAG